MFPVTNSSETIADCLREAAKKARVPLGTGTSLLGVERSAKNGFRLEVRSEAKVFFIQTQKLLMATGSDRKTLEILRCSLGHSIEQPVPSLLLPYDLKDARIAGLAGVSVEDVHAENGFHRSTRARSDHALGAERTGCITRSSLGCT